MLSRCKLARQSGPRLKDRHLRRQQGLRLCSEPFCKLLKVIYRDVGHRPFDLANVCSMEPAFHTQFLLREALGFTESAHVPRHYSAQPRVDFILINFVHARRFAERRLFVYSSNVYCVYTYCANIYTSDVASLSSQQTPAGRAN